MSAIDALWYEQSAAAKVGRALLSPASWLYGAGVSARNARFENDPHRVIDAGIPVLSLGNLTVGGTGKTPLAAWAARELHERGARPAIVLRGYGADEVLVHRALNPDLVVIADGDRVRGVEAARALGATCAILDDAFQHRRIRRLSDWVLVAAESWRDDLRLLPAGPLREPVAALARAHAVIVTRKSASLKQADAILASLTARFPGLAPAVFHLAPSGLVNVLSGGTRPAATLVGERVVAVAALGATAPFFTQLREAGSEVDPIAFRDHHAFTTDDVRSIVARSAAADAVVCTLKDAVKLGPLWPRAAPPLWYVSQLAVCERGCPTLDRALEAVATAAARPVASPTAGLAGPSSSRHGHRSSTAD